MNDDELKKIFGVMAKIGLADGIKRLKEGEDKFEGYNPNTARSCRSI